MSIIVSEGSGTTDFQLVPEGVHQAVCDMVVDLGLQETEWKGKKSKKHQLYVRWQIPEERINYTDRDGKDAEGPMVIGRTYTATLDERSNLRRDLAAWRGRDFTEDELNEFDVAKIIGKNCQIQIQHKKGEKRTYANIGSIMALPKGCATIPHEGDLVVYDSDHDSYDKLPEWLAKKVDSQIICKRENDALPPDDGPMAGEYDGFTEDDIPF